MLTPEQTNTIKRLTLRVNPSMVGFFGSYARNEQEENSDLDILITPGVRVNLLDLIGLEQDLSESLGVKVDLITSRSLNPDLKKYIEEDFIRII